MSIGFSAIGFDPIGAFQQVQGGVVADPVVTSVTVTPATATGSTAFSATVNGENSPSQVVTWSIFPDGLLDSSGNFTAPAAASDAQVFTIIARSVQDPRYADAAIVTIAALPRVSPPAFVSGRKGRGKSRARR